MLKLIAKDQECANALETAKLQVLRKHSPIGSKSLNGEPFSIITREMGFRRCKTDFEEKKEV